MPGKKRAVAVAVLGLMLGADPAQASYPHVVTSGETLWSIAGANGLSPESVASFNGISADTLVIEGQTINIPAEGEGGVTADTSAAPATPAAPSGGGHTLVAGESLSSVAAANGVTVSALAAENGLAADAYLIEGQSISIPAASSVPAGMGEISSPSGPLPLDPAAADSWNAMRDDSLNNYGVDLYPAGPASAYRTTEQQQELYDLYLSGQGAPANPPGTSSHEFGVAVDLADPSMRDIVDQIGAAYGWAGTIPAEWWHVAYGP
jgi:LysM repeat protein